MPSPNNAACAPEGIGLTMKAGVALLNPAVMSAAEQFAGFRKESGANGDSAFGAAESGFVKSHGKHLFVKCSVAGHRR